MVWTLVANIRGPRGYNGDQGIPGPQGIPGTGAVPADTAVAGYVGTAGTSATKTALQNTVQALPSVHHDFSGDPDGTPAAVLDSGQTVDLQGSQKQIVAGGALTQATGTSGTASAYLNVTTANPVRRIGAEFVLQSSASSGILALVNWQNQFQNPIPPANAHLVLTGTSWSFGPYLGQNGGGFAPIATFDFLQPLLAGVLYRVEMIIDADRGTVTILLPDGNTYTCSDARIQSFNGNHPTWENLSNTDTDVEVPVRILRIWADDNPAAPFAGVRGVTSPRDLTVSRFGLTASQATTLSDSSFVQVDQTDMIVPASKRARIDGLEYVQMNNVKTNLYVQTSVGGDTSRGFTQLLGNTDDDFLFAFGGELDLSDYIPGTKVTVAVKMQAASTATHRHLASANMRNSLTVTPLPINLI
jgi:hypothetical protein